MPRVNEMIESKFLKKEDVDNEGRGSLVTITDANQYNVAAQGAPEDLKWCLDLKEFEKPFVLNVTNTKLIEKFLASDNTDDWIGKQIVLYNDPSIMYKGEVKGGVRVRASKRPQPVIAQQPKAAQSIPPGGYKQAPAPQQDVAEDEIPFD